MQITDGLRRLCKVSWTWMVPRRMAAASIGLFVLALFLDFAEHETHSWSTSSRGWQAMLNSIIFLLNVPDAIVNFNMDSLWVVNYALLGCVGSPLILISGILIFWGKNNSQVLWCRRLLVVMVLGAAAVPLDPDLTVRIGYFVWLVSLLLMLVATCRIRRVD